MNSKFWAVLSLALLAGPMTANADIRTWDFAVIIDEDFGTISLPVGTVLTGNVSLDDTDLEYGGFGYPQTGLIYDLSFSFGGTDYDETNGDSGDLVFNPDGSLLYLLIGNDCIPGGCIFGMGDRWALSIGSYVTCSGCFPGFAGNTTSGIAVFGHASFAERQYDPATLLEQLGTAVTGVGPGKSLANKMLLAQTYFAVPDVQATCATLTAFLNQVRAQRGKKLTPALGDQLTTDAQAVMAAIGCN